MAQAARVEVREDAQRQTAWQAVGEVVSDGSQFLSTDDVTESLQLMSATEPDQVLDDCQTL